MKRTIDFTFSLVLLIMLSPVFVIIALLVRLNLGSPVIFGQQRPGLNGELFTLFKFRSMSNKSGADGELLPDNERLSRFGRLLRATSMDEIPSLINVLLGDMSFIGPRPLLIEYLPLYSSTQARRHEVRPGITGWAQVNGRNAISWDEKFKLDVWYVENQSLVLDLRIVAMTLKSVILREGISEAGEATMSKFTGQQ